MSQKSLEGMTPEQIEAMAATYHGLLSNPETREMALRATKKVNPSLSVPEVELKDLAAREFKARDDKIDEQARKLIEMEARERVTNERAALRDQGFSKDEVAAIEKLMIEKQIPSWATAAEFYRGQQKMAEPAPHVPSPNPTTYSMPTDALGALKGGRQALTKFARETAGAALQEIRSGQVKLPH